MSKLLLFQLRDLAELDLGIGVRFYTGSAAHHWLYDLGVPEIKLEGNTEDSYPYYPDPIYKEYYYRLEVRSSLHSLIENSLVQIFAAVSWLKLQITLQANQNWLDRSFFMCRSV